MGYPNLELLEYKVRQLLSNNEEFKEKLSKSTFPHPEFDTVMFPQTWGSTCLGFDVTPNGAPAIGGCALTKAYTTVLRELRTDTYVVCFGDKPCYSVTEATEEFYSDFASHNMASLSKAKERY